MGKLSDTNLSLLNSIYDNMEKQDVMDISIYLRENVNIDAGNAMSDEYKAMVASNKYHQKLLNIPAVDNPKDEYDWYAYDDKFETIVTELKSMMNVDRLYRLRMAYMDPTERVEPHIDQPHIDRFTMVMQNEHTFILTVRGVEHRQVMKPGDVWYINTNWDHSVIIENDKPRVALLGCFNYGNTE